jgi:hypothetical protein
MSLLILNRAPIVDNEEDYDVLENSEIVGRIFLVPNRPPNKPWMWVSGHNRDIRRAALQRARKRWVREVVAGTERNKRPRTYWSGGNTLLSRGTLSDRGDALGVQTTWCLMVRSPSSDHISAAAQQPLQAKTHCRSSARRARWRKAQEANNDQVDRCCWLLSPRNFGASNNTSADPSAGRHYHASSFGMRPR